MSALLEEFQGELSHGGYRALGGNFTGAERAGLRLKGLAKLKEGVLVQDTGG